MHWNEVLHQIKKTYTEREFVVPSHDRKKMLKSIEDNFIKPPQQYFHLSSYQGPFRNWWENFMQPSHVLNCSWSKLMNKIALVDSLYWSAFEDKHGGILVYKSSLEPMAILQARAETRVTFLISLDYMFMLAAKKTIKGLEVKFKGFSTQQEQQVLSCSNS